MVWLNTKWVMVSGKFLQTHGIVAEVCLASASSLQDNGFDELVICGGHVDIIVGQLHSTTFLDLFY